MTPAMWFAVGQSVVMMIVAVVVFYWGRDRAQGAAAIAREFVDLRAALGRMEIRLTEAGERTSTLATRVQVVIGRLDRLPEDLRDTFVSKDLASTLTDESRRDRAALWAAIQDHLKETRHD